VLRQWLKHTLRRTMEALIRALVHWTARTCRWEFVDCELAEKALFDGDEGVILVTPHENVISMLALGLAGWPFKGKVVISNHRTVDWIYRLTEKLGIDLIIVDKNNPSQNVNEAVKETLAKGETVLITPDGPLGPPHIFDPGVWLLARRHKARVVFLNGIWTRQFRVNTWDHHKIPLPFTKGYILGIDPFVPGKEFAGVRHEDIMNGSADPNHPAVKVPADMLAKVKQAEREILGRRL